MFLGRDFGHEANYSDEVAGHDRRRGAPADRRRPRPGPVHPRRPTAASLDRLAAALVEKETLDDADLAEVFGDVDKGAGIEDVPQADLERPRQIVPDASRPSVTVAEAAPPEVRPVPSAPPEPAWRRMLRRWGMHPRPSGT